MAQKSMQVISHCHNGGTSGGTNGAKLDAREFHVGVSLIHLNICRHTRVSAASATVCTWVGGAHWVSGVQPEHVCIVIIPQGHDKNHTCINGLLDGIQASLLQEVCAVLRDRNPITAEVISDCVVLFSVDAIARVLDGLAVLLVELLHLHQLAMISAIVGDELCGDGDRLG